MPPRWLVSLLLACACSPRPPLPWPSPGGPTTVLLDRAPKQVRTAPGAQLSDPRLDPARAGLAPDAFVRYAAKIGDTRHEGLLLVPGVEVALSLEIPHHATFSAEVVPLGRGGDGATARLRTDQGLEASLAIPPGADPRPWRVDLPPGRAVLRLVAEPGPDAREDALFLANPMISAPNPDPRRIVWIGVDTLRRDRLGLYGHDRPTSPHLDQLAAGAVVFDDAVAPAPRTRPSFHSALTGRPPLQAIGAPTFLAELADLGFVTAGIVSNVHLDPRFDFADGAGQWRLDPAARAPAQVDRALAFLQANQGRDAALFLHIMDPHLPYDPPDDLRSAWVRDPDPRIPTRFNREQVIRWQRQGALDARKKAHISDLYDAEVASTDREIGRLLAAIDQLPGRTLVVVHSDHGEELWDHGGFEHNHTLKPEVLDAVLMVRGPGLAPRRVPEPVALSELAPAILAWTRGHEDERPSLLSALRGEPLPPRAHGVGLLMYDHERWGVRMEGYTYTIRTLDGLEEVYVRATDPAEDRPLGGIDPARFREATARYHGADIGPGWRITAEMRGPFNIVLPVPATAAGVLDPEALSPHRANLEWGEVAPVTPTMVANVALSADGKTLSVSPGSHGAGTLYVRFPNPEPVRAIFDDGTRVLAVEEGLVVGAPGTHRARIEAGIVVVPPPGEFARRQARSGATDGLDPATLRLLRDLGYVGGGKVAE